MYKRDPVSSSPPLGDDELAGPGPGTFVTQPTQPLDNIRSPHFTTQPTLPVTPHPESSQVQVARSSPAAERLSSPVMSQAYAPSQSQRAFAPMAPPGTSFFPPRPVPRPPPVDLTSEDPPVEPDSEEEIDPHYQSNIKPSKSISREARVEDTPPQKSSFGIDMSVFSYNAANPRKRPADGDMASDPPQGKKYKPAPKQNGPSRAIPVDLTGEDDDRIGGMRLEDIADPALRTKVARIKAVHCKHSVESIQSALLKHKGNSDDASTYLLDQASEDEELPTLEIKGPKKTEPKKTAQRKLDAPVKTLLEKYVKPKSNPAPATSGAAPSPEKPKKRGKLMRGRRTRSPSLDNQLTSPRPQKKHKIEESEDENEGIDEAILIPSDDDDSHVNISDDDEFDEGSLLNFFNTASSEDMVDLSGHKEQDIVAIFAHRPFASLAAIEKIHVNAKQTGNGKKARKPRLTLGERLVESARAMWTAYNAIDKVVKACEEHGKPMVTAMARWGIDVFGSSTDGEVAITALDDSSIASRDSGYHTPQSTNGSDVESDSLRKTVFPSGKTRLLKKPAIMNSDVELKDYQVVGLNWLALLWRNGISGILADDMGLGKTCQVIAFLSHLKEQARRGHEQEAGPHLIVVPGSTLENWLREFEHFSREINVVPYYGSQAERFEAQETVLNGIHNGAVDVIVTTYDLACKRDDKKFLRKCQPKVCIFDEGHVLRNCQTQRYKALMGIGGQCRLLLTGTPLQNSLQELTSILAFLMPVIFNKDVEEDLGVVFKHKAKVNESDRRNFLSSQRIQRARSMMTPFILRRKKAQVLQHLPKKTCRVEHCELTDVQKTLYDAQLERQRRVLLDRAKGLIPKDQANIMMKLRQAAIHPLLFRHYYDDDKIAKMSKACLKEERFVDSSADAIYQDLEVYQDYQCHQLATMYPRALGKFELQNREWMLSGKVAKLVELLKRFKENGDRALVFSQFTSVMDILGWVFDDLDIGYCRLDGSTPVKQRQELLDKFYSDASIPVFMLSTKSGGAGINLACANKVVIFDSSFNPQDDIQAENRAHRVGQTREVEVVRLVTKDTVEEQIHALGVSKLELDKMVSGEDAGSDGAATKKKSEAMSKAEEAGMEAVEKMLLKQMAETTRPQDTKDEFLNGLKNAGLDMSAA